jgi:hypothetical protein
VRERHEDPDLPVVADLYELLELMSLERPPISPA